jgi:hypothetical protein
MREFLSKLCDPISELKKLFYTAETEKIGAGMQPTA